MGEEMTANLVVSAPNMALHTRRPESVSTRHSACWNIIKSVLRR
jgi:hypothetical protein